MEHEKRSRGRETSDHASECEQHTSDVPRVDRMTPRMKFQELMRKPVTTSANELPDVGEYSKEGDEE